MLEHGLRAQLNLRAVLNMLFRRVLELSLDSEGAVFGLQFL